MKNTYNITVNLKIDLINFYEWEKTDKLTILKKVKVLKITNDIFTKIINKNIKITENTLNEINIDNKYICIFASDYDTICVNFNEKGQIKKLSKLSLEDDSEVLENVYKLKNYNLEYNQINNNKNKISILTRKEKNKIKTIKKKLEKIKNNKDILDYIYNEWYDSKAPHYYNQFIKDISSNYTSKHKELYELIKLLT